MTHNSRRSTIAKNERRRPSGDRLRWINVVLIACLAIIAIRLFDLQVLQHDVYSALAEGQRTVFSRLFPRRGEVFMGDRLTPGDLLPLAVNRDYDLLYAVPASVEQPALVARALAPLIGMDEVELAVKLSKPGDQYEALLHRVPADVRSSIEALNLQGIAFQKESLRYYPEGRTASHLVGFLGYSGESRKGQYGIEGYYDAELAGTPGSVPGERVNTLALFEGASFREAEDGSDILLTIDRTVQFRTCEALRTSVEKHGGTRGVAIVADPKTGKLLAVCGFPDFDPNEYAKTEDITVFANPGTFSQYEPGSTFKAITMAAGLEAGLIEPTTTYTDEGSVQIGKYTIRNADGKTYGTKTMSEVLEESINTGAIFVARKVGTDQFRHVVEAFGFGSKTGVEIEGEAAGDISNLERRGEIYLATASFGQGITITPMQLLMAFSAIANNGKLMKPSVVEAIVRPDGTRTEVPPEAVRQVIAPETARTLAGMLTSVVERGHGQRAGVAGFYVAGKTGTAQVHSADGVGYDPNRTIGTFVGFAPVDEPRFAMLVRIDDPKDVRFAESTAAPVFGELAKFLLDYFEVPPDVTADN